MSREEKINFFDMGLTGIVTPADNSNRTESVLDNFNLDNTLEIMEKQYITTALKQSGGTKSKAARLLGFSNYQRLDARIKKLKIQPELE